MLFQDGVFYMVRGDDESVAIDLRIVQDPLNEDDQGTEYLMAPEDYLVMTVRKLPSLDSPVLLQVRGDPGVPMLNIPHDVTAGLEVGRYSMDIELMIYGTTRRTVWPDWSQIEKYKRSRISNIENFVIMPEVTM